MYVIPANPTIYNRKWDRNHTEYQISAGITPGLPGALPAANPVVPISRPAPAINLPPSKRPCRACQCARKPSLSGMGFSPRGISIPPQKRLRGLHRLGDAANACTYYANDGTTVESIDQNSDPTECAANGGTWGQPPGSTTTSVGLPAGSILSYTAAWSQAGWQSGPSQPIGWNDPSAVLAAITPILLNQFAIRVLSSVNQSSSFFNASGQNGFSLTLQTASDRNLPSDVQSIVDGLIYQIGKVMPRSAIILTKSVTAPGAGAPAANLTAWFTQNWPLIVGGGIALVAVKEL